MVEYGQIAANWGQLIEDNINIIVPVNHYSMKDDPRFLIPFQKADKFGMLNKDGEIVVDAKYDHISSDDKWIKVGVRYSYGYCRKNNSVQTYDSVKWGILDTKGNFVLDPIYGSIVICDHSFIVREAYGHGRRKAVLDLSGNIIVPFGTYWDIEPFVNGFARCRIFTVNEEKKRIELCGVINEQGDVILECNERRINPFYGRYKFKGLKFLKDVIMRENPSILDEYLAKHTRYDSTNDNVQEDYGSHYGEFAGSYAQDVMGFSDDVINDAFEGDPDAYWNID